MRLCSYFHSVLDLVDKKRESYSSGKSDYEKQRHSQGRNHN